MAPKSFLLACLLAFTVQIFFSLSVSSLASLLSISKESSSMKGLTKLGEGCVNHPEDVSVVGLLKVTEEGVEAIVPHAGFTNDVIAASDGTLYFTVASTKYTPTDFYKDMAEGKPYGQLRKYDPKLKETTVLHEGFYFANGIALSKNEDFVVVCESWKRYWLKGDRAGILDAFIENLPGGPDNINLAPDGSFWIGLIKMNQTGVRAIQKCREKWELLDAYPGLISLLLPMGSDAGARVVKVDGNDGKIIRDFNDPDATYISFVTSAAEFDGNLYLASLQSNFIGILPLDGPEPQLATI
ncbi:Str synth domain-containing protein [Citrus sinensis]|uniref:Str synth domain-containing protein n=1 Tax=Citrus sinensis TaxID=2711 RepID=A0ACB8L781_CITSI|nr:Str synth domain-containing protein [Citrus sinensis]